MFFVNGSHYYYSTDGGQTLVAGTFPVSTAYGIRYMYLYSSEQLFSFLFDTIVLILPLILIKMAGFSLLIATWLLLSVRYFRLETDNEVS